MTVYHTATQEDYDALMVELEEKGCTWLSGSKPKELDYFDKYGEETCVRIWEDNTLTSDGKPYYELLNNIEIIEYKAKKKPELPEWARWIARDEDGSLWVFEGKPYKKYGESVWFTESRVDKRLEEIEDQTNYYSFINWEDKEPYEINNEQSEDNMPFVGDAVKGTDITEDVINKPNHYHSNGIDVIGFAEAQFSKEELKGFYRINAIKYLTRFDKKGTPLQDLEKAQFYLNKLLEGEE